jgi:hypothetical protein
VVVLNLSIKQRDLYQFAPTMVTLDRLFTDRSRLLLRGRAGAGSICDPHRWRVLRHIGASEKGRSARSRWRTI